MTIYSTAIFFIKSYGIGRNDIISERQLRHELGFNPRVHLPDLIFTKDGKKYCVEVELSMKAKSRLDKNIKDNYLKYDVQDWVIPQSKVKIMEYVERAKSKYPNIEVIPLEVVQEYVRNFKQKL